jgi:hypothetical protein
MEFELGKSCDTLQIGDKGSFTKTISEMEDLIRKSNESIIKKKRRKKKWLLPT